MHEEGQGRVWGLQKQKQSLIYQLFETRMKVFPALGPQNGMSHLLWTILAVFPKFKYYRLHRFSPLPSLSISLFRIQIWGSIFSQSKYDFFSSPSMIMLISDLFDQQIIIKAKFVSVFIIIKWSFYFSPITMGIGQSKDFDTSKLGSFWDVIVLDDTPIETFLGELLNQW